MQADTDAAEIRMAGQKRERERTMDGGQSHIYI